MKSTRYVMIILCTGGCLLFSPALAFSPSQQPESAPESTPAFAPESTSGWQVTYEFLHCSDFITNRIEKEGRTFFKTLIGLSKDQVVDRFSPRTQTNPLGWVHSEDCTLFLCGDINANSKVEICYKAGLINKVREIRWSTLFIPEAKNGRITGKWVR